MPHYTHRLEVEDLASELKVLEFVGHEGLSQLFEFEVTVFTEDHLAFDDVVGSSVVLTIRPFEDDDARYVSGIVSRLEQGEENKQFKAYRLTIVPAMWKLLHRFDNRIFQELTAPEVIQKVLEAAGLTSGDDFKLSLQGTYAPREYCVQYRESDFAFVSRLMEEEGIFYFFEQKPMGHVLVLGDKPSVHQPIEGEPKLVFRPPQGALGAIVHGLHVSRLSYAEEVRPGKVTLRDYDFKKPALSLEAEASADKNEALEIYDYPGEYGAPAQGKSLAAVRLEELQSLRRAAEGDSTCARLTPGSVFSIDEHPRESFNREYLICRVEHRGTQIYQDDIRADDDEEKEERTPYANRFEIMPSDLVFRPQRTTRRPNVQGVQTAIVVGPAGEEIHTDEHGRVKVQFHWDRLGKKDDKSSCWMRVSQLWAGEGWGSIFIPRIKQEVVVTFLEGDPDQPLIVGRVYHGTNVVPYALPANKTRSTIKSNSSSGGDGFNELRFEDKKGSEEVYLHSQKDTTIRTENDKNQFTGHDETLDVENDRTKTIKRDQKAEIGRDNTILVKHDHKQTIDHDETHTVKHDRKVDVTNDHTETVGNNQKTSVTKDQSLDVGGAQTVAITKSVTVTIGEDFKETISGAVTQAIAKDVTLTVDGAFTETIQKDFGTTINGAHTVKVTKDATESVTGNKTIKVTGTLKIECGGAKITVEPSGAISIEGTNITLKGSGPVKVEGAQIDVKATAGVSLEGNAPVKVKSSAMVDVQGAMVKIAGQLMLG